MFCPNCGRPCPEEIRFCPMCGAVLPPKPESPAPDTPVPQEFPEPANGEAAAAPQSRQEQAAPVPEGEDPLPSVEPQPAASEAEAPDGEADTSAALPSAPKKGRHLPAVLVMAGMLAVGLLLFFLIPGGGANGASGEPWFSMDGSTLSFNDSAYTGESELTVPDTVGGQPVQSLSTECFAGSDLTTVLLPDGLTAIGDRAFADCGSLRGIYLPDKVRSIGQDAFSGCEKLEAICIPSTTAHIGERAFDGCYKLRYIFYSGTHASWEALYPGYISPFTWVVCADGVYRQGGTP